VKCFTFTNCQLKEGLKLSMVTPNSNSKRSPEEVLALGKYVQGTGREFNMARHIKMDNTYPPEVEVKTEAERIIPCVLGSMGIDLAGFDSLKTKCILKATPNWHPFRRDDGTHRNFLVISNWEPFEKSSPVMHVILRVKTFSYETENGRAGDWNAVKGNPSVIASARGTDNGCTWKDDLIVLHGGSRGGDIIRIVTMGSDPSDDQVVMNFYGDAAMCPASVFAIPGNSDMIKKYAEEVECGMIEALEEV